MAKKADPFGDIYSSLGVEDLFVKKTLGEMKKPAAPPPAKASPVPSILQPMVQHTLSTPAPASASFDMDFLGSLRQQQPPLNSSAQPASTSAMQPKAPVANEDPFAAFGSVATAAPIPAAVPKLSPSTQSASMGNLLGFDGGHEDPFGFSGAPASAPAPAHTLSSPLHVPVHASPTPAPAQSMAPASSIQSPPPPPAYEDSEDLPSARTSGWPTGPAPAATSVYGHMSSTSVPAHRAAEEPQEGWSASSPRHGAAPGPAYPSTYAARTSSSNGGAPATPQYHQQTASHTDAYSQERYPERYHSQYESGPVHGYSGMPGDAGMRSWGHEPPYPDHAGAPSTSGTSSQTGISGYLKAFGKKAVKAAKAGLATIEAALEDHAVKKQEERHGYSTSHMQPYARRGSDEGGAEISSDEALAWAVRLADMTPHAQEQQLSQMPRALRSRVVEVLHEQVRSEAEARQAAAAGRASHAGQGGLQRMHGRMNEDHFPQGAAGGVGGLVQPHMSPLTANLPQYVQPAQHAQRADVSELHGAASGSAVAASASPGPLHHAQQQLEVQHGDLLGLDAAADSVYQQAGNSRPGNAPMPAHTPASSSAAAAVFIREEDLLGLDSPVTSSSLPQVLHAAAPSSASGTTPPAHTPGSSAPMPASVLTEAGVRQQAAGTPQQLPTPAVVQVEDMDHFFSGPSATTQPPSIATFTTKPASANTIASASSSMLGRPSAAVGAAPGPVKAVTTARASSAAKPAHDFGLEGLMDVGSVDVARFSALYAGEADGGADEPEIRKQLRAQRIAEKHAKMKAALAEQQAAEAAEAAKREEQVVLKDQHKAAVEAWKKHHKANIRGLLSTLHTVLWEGSNWVTVGMGDLLEPNQVKKVYMRANLLVHPDKVCQRGGGPEQVALADMIFDVLKEAWNTFNK